MNLCLYRTTCIQNMYTHITSFQSWGSYTYVCMYIPMYTLVEANSSAKSPVCSCHHSETTLLIHWGYIPSSDFSFSNSDRFRPTPIVIFTAHIVSPACLGSIDIFSFRFLQTQTTVTLQLPSSDKSMNTKKTGLVHTTLITI